ncbi:MAG TPA: glycosyltransferase family 2 protein, partial [Beijerinckiaceae bacterium]|nr:glycosyltransferase family 2 protein [Beijerinckiaceae bacterium]
MAVVTIAVPVYNGEALIGEALRCLQDQSLRDLEIIVLDNASTDRTADIAEEFAQSDPRFKIIRQPFNKGAVANFIDGIAAASGEFFAWRAFDDLSDPNYFEILRAALLRAPNAALAVGTIQSMDLDGGGKRIRALPKLGGGATRDVWALLFGSHAAWFYGLWRRPLLLPMFHKALEIFPEAWGSDHLILFPFLLDRNICFDEDAIFYQRLKRSSESSRQKSSVPVSEMLRIRADFGRACRAFLDADETMTPFER